MAYRLLDSKEEIHEDGVWCCAWNNKANIIVTGSVDTHVKIWKGDGFKNIHKLSGHRLGVISVDIDKDGKIAISSSIDSVIRVWDLEKGKSIATIEATPIEAWTACLSPNAKNIATGSQSGNINIFDITTGKKEQSFDTQKKVFVMALSYVIFYYKSRVLVENTFLRVRMMEVFIFLKLELQSYYST